MRDPSFSGALADAGVIPCLNATIGSTREARRAGRRLQTEPTAASGVSGDPARPDNIVYDITPQAGEMPGVSAGGWGHPACTPAATAIAAALPPVR